MLVLLWEMVGSQFPTGGVVHWLVYADVEEGGGGLREFGGELYAVVQLVEPSDEVVEPVPRVLPDGEHVVDTPDPGEGSVGGRAKVSLL